MEEYVTVYACITTDKHDGIKLNGVYFGGVGDKVSATKTAVECVESIRNGIIIPKVLEINNNLMITIEDGIDMFRQLVSQMKEAEKIINRKRKVDV